MRFFGGLIYVAEQILILLPIIFAYIHEITVKCFLFLFLFFIFYVPMFYICFLWENRRERKEKKCEFSVFFPQKNVWKKLLKHGEVDIRVF